MLHNSGRWFVFAIRGVLAQPRPLVTNLLLIFSAIWSRLVSKPVLGPFLSFLLMLGNSALLMRLYSLNPRPFVSVDAVVRSFLLIHFVQAGIEAVDLHKIAL